MPDVTAGDVAIVLGRIPDLSLKEIELSLARSGAVIDQLTVTSGVALVKASPAPTQRWFQTLGGATKFGIVLDRIQPDSGSFVDCIQRTLGVRKSVGISGIGIGGQEIRELGQMLKLAELARRFVTPESGTVLSGAQSKQFRSGKDAELLVLSGGGQWTVILIQAVQNIDDLTLRDRGAPFQHSLRGMLPTKLARVMVNIGLGMVPGVKSPMLLDPFCGTGRVLMEGMLLGAQVWGSDIDPVAIEATQGNLDWLARRYELVAQPLTQRLIASDIAALGTYLKPGSIDVIVTEPDLGPPQTRALGAHEAERVFTALKPTYEHLLETAAALLTPAGAMVVVFPVIGGESLQTRMVDSIERFGYHALDSFRVAREDQFVTREVALLTRDQAATE